MTWILLAAYMGQSYYFGRHESERQCQAQIAVHKSACPACRIQWKCEPAAGPAGARGVA